jgi:4-aminobutyrate aminotransferase/(S)-3-amino-2-methylpropionate transaminase
MMRREKIESEKLAALREKVISSGYTSASGVYVASARGALVWDVDGNEYIDFAGGIGVMNVGHSHPRVVKAIKEQAEKFTHTCFMVLPYESAIRLAEKLCDLAPMDPPKSAFFANSGAEAVENAVKFARYYSKRSAIIALQHAFHGRTLLTMTLTSKINPYKLGFGPFAPEVYHIPSPYCYRCHFGMVYPKCGLTCAEYLREAFLTVTAAETTAAVIAEPVQGEGGFIVPPFEYFSRLTEICRQNGVLFIADEIQSGMGRTGKMFAIEHYHVQPDLLVVGKSLAAGVPLSAVVGRKEIMDSVHSSGVGGTYGANPLACQAAIAVMEIFEEEALLARAQKLGEKMRSRMESWKLEYEIVGDVRGLGPMRAIELVRDKETKEPAKEEAVALANYCLEKGLVILVCGTLGNVVRFLPPLTITDEELDKGMAIVEEGLTKTRR